MPQRRVGIVAPSSVVPAVHLSRGLERLKESGFDPLVHPQCRQRYLLFAGKDRDRASALYDAAIDPATSVIWSALGGSGAVRLVPWLDRLTEKRGVPPRKLLVGYSDITVLLEYVRKRWRWSTLHAPMPCQRDFSKMKEGEWKRIAGAVRGERDGLRWPKLGFLTHAPRRAVSAPMVGGNLTLWSASMGTPYAARAPGKILFLEDVSENLSRIDRMVWQLLDSGAFDGVRAIVLGTFYDCEDDVPKVMKRPPARGNQPLRAKIGLKRGLTEIFRPVSERYGIPVAYELRVGHGSDGHLPLPLGAKYRLDADGNLALVDWDWLRN